MARPKVDANRYWFISNEGQLNQELLNRMLHHTRLARVLEAFMANPEHRLSLEEAASCARMGRAAFSRFFYGVLKVQFVDFRIAFRVARAVELMLASDIPCREVAKKSGFGSITSFEYAFHRVFGLAPQAFRRAELMRRGFIPPPRSSRTI